MRKITFVSTVHKENGKCNDVELCNIIEKINPDVIFLEALEETYTKHDKAMFHQFGLYHNKLEVSAIQRYNLKKPLLKYIPVLDNGMPGFFDNKYRVLARHKVCRELLDNYNLLASKHGFSFLNSTEGETLQEQMRKLESKLIGDELEESFKRGIEEYENAMIENIYSYSKDNQFDSAIFMCGAAHRRSVIEKLVNANDRNKANLDWIIYET